MEKKEILGKSVNPDMIIRSAGFLKIPREFKKKHPNVEYAETPICSVVESDQSGDGGISLIYHWKPNILEEA